MSMTARELPPQGDPDSKTCRHCDGLKLVVRGARLCRKCDAPDFTKPTWRMS